MGAAGGAGTKGYSVCWGPRSLGTSPLLPCPAVSRDGAKTQRGSSQQPVYGESGNFPRTLSHMASPILGGSGMSQPWGSFPAYNKYENFTERQPVWQTPPGGKGSVWLLLASTDSSQTGVSPSQWLWEPHYAAGTHVMVLFVAATRGRGGAGPLGEGVPPAGPSPVPALRVWWGSEHLWWRAWRVASR